MKRIVLLCCFIFGAVFILSAQVANSLQNAWNVFNADEQLTYALTSLYVVDATNKEVVFKSNENVGMAPASTQKNLIAATALEVLGKDFVFETKIGFLKKSDGYHLYIQPSGDPSFGSWRYEETKEFVVLNKMKEAIKKSGINRFESVIIAQGSWEDAAIPEGWIWQDLGNYYGASPQVLNWRENQFDLLLQSPKTLAAPAKITGTKPFMYDYPIEARVTAAAANSGDNTYVYYPTPFNKAAVIKGTIPLGSDNFAVSASIPDPANQWVKTLEEHIKDIASIQDNQYHITKSAVAGVQWLYTHQSPPLSKLVYWFLRKSINLYGEAFLRKTGEVRKGHGSVAAGIAEIQAFWAQQGVAKNALNLFDGSGLSPQNRLTTKTEVSVLQYAIRQKWYTEFYEGLPLYNEMKMKSGTINSVKGFTGYHKAKNGKSYLFSFLVNNYSGSEMSLVRKMYKVLDVLK